jgi:hypothetical protein
VQLNLFSALCREMTVNISVRDDDDDGGGGVKCKKREVLKPYGLKIKKKLRKILQENNHKF